MSYVELVIKIPEDEYDEILYPRKYIRHGVLLPKGHGKLITEPTEEEIAETIDGNNVFAECIREAVKAVFDNAKTIIPADEEDVNPYEKCKTCGQNRESCCGCPEVLELEQKKRSMTK